MSIGARMKERMADLGISQAELARRVGVTQPAIHALLARNKSGSRSLHKIARELHTTPAYLNGETDDPGEGAIPPPPPPPVHLMMRVELPSEATLTEMFRTILSVSRDMDEEELAHELAKRLPIGLEIAQRVRPTYRQAFSDDHQEPADTHHDERPPRRRAAGR